MGLHIIAHCDTFDPRFDPAGKPQHCNESQLSALVARTRIADTVHLEILPAQGEGKRLHGATRSAILEACRSSACSAIVIVHGCDTLCETATALAAARFAKTIILTGPTTHQSLQHPEVSANLGFACGMAHARAPGVYVAVHGQLFDGARVRKNYALGVFEAY